MDIIWIMIGKVNVGIIIFFEILLYVVYGFYLVEIRFYFDGKENWF